jgi:hypothetical protein
MTTSKIGTEVLPNGIRARRFDMHFFPFSPPPLAERSSGETGSICRSRRHEVRSKRHRADAQGLRASREGERDRGSDLSRIPHLFSIDHEGNEIAVADLRSYSFRSEAPGLPDEALAAEAR